MASSHSGVIDRFADWCDLLDEGMNPVANRDLGILTRKKQVAGALFLAQVLGLGTVALELMDPTSMSDGNFGPLHFVAAAFMICVVPLQAGALGQEEKRNAELVLITGMTPMRIAVGRLMAVMFPAVTVLVSLAPYFLLRYFIGVAEPIHDLEFIGTCIAMSSVLSAAVLGMHTFRFVKGLYAVGITGTCAASFGAVFSDGNDGLLHTLLQMPLFWLLGAAPATMFFLAVAAASCQYRDNLLVDSGSYGVAAILGSALAVAVGGNSFGAGIILVLVLMTFLMAGVAAAIYDVMHNR